MEDITKKYSNTEITIVWKPGICVHSTLCWKGQKGLPQVFNPTRRPWINTEGAGTSEIIARVNNCPSGALSYYYNNDVLKPEKTEAQSIVEVVPDGPLLVYGNITVIDNKGKESKKNKVTAFCRCGHSSNKPFCDGTHVGRGFKD